MAAIVLAQRQKRLPAGMGCIGLRERVIGTECERVNRALCA